MDRTLVDLLGLPDVPHAVFESSPLVLTICQIRFPHVLGVASPAFVAPFQHAIQEHYPVALPVDEIELQIGVGGKEAEIQHKSRSPQWQFADLSDTWKVVLAQDFVGIETRAYQQFADFTSRLRLILDALVQHIQPQIGTRIGLRYINEIRVGHQSPTVAIRRQLLGPLAAPELNANVAEWQALQQLQLRFPEDQGISIRHGLFPRGSTVQPHPGQEPPAGPFYLLDFDAYREFPLPPGLPLNPIAICDYVQTCNRAIYRLFRWAVTEDYVSTLGVIS